MPDDTFTETIAKGGKKAAETVADTFEDTGDAFRTATKDIGALATAAQADTKEGARQVTEYVRESIHERPNLTLGIAAGLGVLLGLMLSGRR
jgi:ElaB/YqjD/DUF883 family membrane-anchored ribosome-binding protein